ncbi:MAG: hypothetical protein FH757_02830 [Alcanivorax sp.]|jgi:hypothetical protein|nr:hypothetical protein [Alcanivorax sp.]
MSNALGGTKAPSSRQLTVLWFLPLSAPLMIGVALALLAMFAHYPPPVELLTRETLWGVSLAAMALVLLLGRRLRNLVMAPERIAHRPLPGSPESSRDVKALAAAKVQNSMFILLGLLNFVSMLVVAACFMHADAELALLNGVYALVLAIITKPDFALAMRETEAVLRRQG